MLRVIGLCAIRRDIHDKNLDQSLVSFLSIFFSVFGTAILVGSRCLRNSFPLRLREDVLKKCTQGAP